MQKVVNPWTGKAKVSKNTGLFNQILFKYYPQLQRTQLKSQYLEMVALIESERKLKSIEEYEDLFDIKSKITKLNEINDWIDKVQTIRNKIEREQETPIDTSFVYIPIHAYNTFHQILKDCIGGPRQPLLKQDSLLNLQAQLANMEQILHFNELIMKNIL